MMAAMASLQSKISSLEKKLRAENDEQNLDKKMQRELGMVPSSPRPRAPRPNLVNINHLSKSPSSAAKRKITMDLPGSPVHRFHERQENLLSAEIDKKMQEIMKLTGILTIDFQKYQTDIKDLHALGELGNGTCGHVVKMLHAPSKKIIAVKQMRRSGNEEESKRIIMDLEVVLKSHDCPYIVRCLGCFITDTDVWICMEHMATCLDKLLKRLRSPIPENIIGKMAVAILNALNYLKEKHGVIHRDVKPSNILLDEKGTVKLCDFGISGRLVDSKAKTRGAGCAAYMAPERIIPPDPRKPDYDIRADVWSLGITLVELATGRFPYVDCKTDFEVLTKILESDPPLLPPSQGFSIDFCSFVKDCLTKDCKSRPKYKKLLQHNFIRRYETLNVDVASWFAQVMRQTEMSRANN